MARPHGLTAASPRASTPPRCGSIKWSPGFGDTATVGIAGLTLGGGVGYLVRKFGLTIDSLLAADLVTADGELMRVDADARPDLFWAIRGGGGNFGVVTRLQYRLHELPSFVGGMLILPATADAICGFMAASEAAPDELSAIANVMPAPPMPFVPAEWHGKPVLMSQLGYVGDVEAGMRAAAPFRALGTPIADMVRPMSYPEIYPPQEGGWNPLGAARTLFVDRVDQGVAATILDRIEEHMRSSGAQMAVAQLRMLGGAMARVPNDATAFAHRDSKIMVNLAAIFGSIDEAPAHTAWVEQFAADLRQSDAGAYVGFIADEGQDRVHDAYPGKTWDRLAAIKARYDPTNLFHLNQNVPPAGSPVAG